MHCFHPDARRYRKDLTNSKRPKWSSPKSRLSANERSFAALASLIIALGDHQSITWPAAIDIVKAVGATWLIFESWTLFGMALAYLFRQSAMAIGIGLAYVLAIEGILFRLLGGFDAGWVTTIEKLFLGQNAGALIKSFGQPFANPGAAAPIVTAGVAVLVLAVYALVFAGVSSLVVRTRDVT